MASAVHGWSTTYLQDLVAILQLLTSFVSVVDRLVHLLRLIERAALHGLADLLQHLSVMHKVAEDNPCTTAYEVQSTYYYNVLVPYQCPAWL